MYLSGLLKKHQIYQKLKEKFPGMAEFAKKVLIIPWSDDFNIRDKNPEVIETIQFLDILLQNKLITQDEYRKQIKKISSGYAARTVGISFMDKKQVSFRDSVPDSTVVLHELGHIYFQVNDLFWNASYGGGEILLWLALKDKYNITENHIRHFHHIIEGIYEDTENTHRLIANTIAPKLNVYPHLYPICLFAGYMPDFDNSITFDFYNDLQSEKWNTLTVDKHHLFSFIQNLTEGLKYNDSFWVSFAKWLKIID
jgi:hypothetical protein